MSNANVTLPMDTVSRSKGQSQLEVKAQRALKVKVYANVLSGMYFVTI